VNGKQLPNEGLTLGMGHEETSVMGYRTLFESSAIHHSNTGLQIRHYMYINGYFMLVFDLTSYRLIALKFNKPLPETITCLLYIESLNSVLIDFELTVTTDF